MWITTDEVIKFTGLKPQHLNFDKEDIEGLKQTLEEWILQAQSLILAYCHIKELEDSKVPLAMKNVCLRLVSNMVSLAIQKRDNPIIKVNDWTIQGLSSDIFTTDLKEDLEPFIHDSTNDTEAIGVLAITGEGVWN